jgi:hypothetical protein
MHPTRDSVTPDRQVLASTRAALVRAIRMRDRGCSEQAVRREEQRALARVRADRARADLALEHVVRWVRDAWDEVYGPASFHSGRELAYHALVSRCLAGCVQADAGATPNRSRRAPGA